MFQQKRNKTFQKNPKSMHLHFIMFRFPAHLVFPPCVYFSSLAHCHSFFSDNVSHNLPHTLSEQWFFGDKAHVVWEFSKILSNSY